MPAKITLKDSVVAKLVKRYTKGATLAELAQEIGVSLGTMSRILRENGAEIRPRGRRPRTA